MGWLRRTRSQKNMDANVKILHMLQINLKRTLKNEKKSSCKDLSFSLQRSKILAHCTNTILDLLLTFSRFFQRLFQLFNFFLVGFGKLLYSSKVASYLDDDEGLEAKTSFLLYTSRASRNNFSTSGLYGKEFVIST